MKKNNRYRKAAVLLALALLLSLAASALPAGTVYAEDDTTSTTYTLSTAADDTHTYAVYQIFTGSVTTDEDGSTSLTSVQKGQNFNSSVTTDVQTVVSAIMSAAVSSSGGTVTDAEKLEEILKYVDLTSDPVGKLSANNSLSLAPGYYLAVDLGVASTTTDEDGNTTTTYAIDGTDSYSLYVAIILTEATTLERKADVPDMEKEVLEENDSSSDAETWGTYADSDIGDSVTFRLTGTLPDDFEQYTIYNYAFHDTLSAGLTLDTNSGGTYAISAAAVTTYSSGTDTEDTTTEETALTYGEDYQVTVTANDDGTTTLTIKMGYTDSDGSFSDNLCKNSKITASCKIVVTYTATLNENAVIAGSGNTNTAYITYSDNPNATSSSDQTGGTSSTSSTVVYTYGLTITKYKEADEEDTTESSETGTDETAAEDTTSEDTTSDDTTSDDASADDATTDGTSADDTTTDGTSADDTTTDGTSGDDTTTDGTSTDDTTTDDTSADGTSSDDTSSDNTSSDDASAETDDGTYTVTNSDGTVTVYEPLEGAGFTLYKYDAESSTWQAVGSEIVYGSSTDTGSTEDGSSANNIYTWTGLDAGIYKLSETTTPAGYQTMDDYFFEITAVIEADSTSSTGYSITGLTGTGTSDPTASSLTSAASQIELTAVYADGVLTGYLSGYVVNELKTALPTTGAYGLVLLIAAIAVILAAAVILRRKSGRGEEGQNEAV